MKTTGNGNEKKILVLFNGHGIGDGVHLLPALAQKLSEGYQITIHHCEFLREMYERVGCTFIDETTSTGRIGFINQAIKEYGAIYSLYQHCSSYEHEVNGQITLTRFQQYASAIETSVPESFDFVSIIYPDAPGPTRDRILLAPRATWKRRSYPYPKKLLSLLKTIGASEFIGYTGRKIKSFAEFVQKIYNAKLVVSVDTGILAFALALGVPTIAIMGGSDEWSIVKQYDQFVTNQVIVVHSNDECRPCSYQQERGFGVNGKCAELQLNGEPKPKFTDCMKIDPHTIFEQAKSL